VGRPGSLTADPLRFAGAGAAGLAVRRLDRDAAGAVPLRLADRALAPLTCLRLETLRDPARGDEALAAALARYGEEAAGVGERGELRAPAAPLRVERPASPERVAAPSPGTRRLERATRARGLPAGAPVERRRGRRASPVSDAVTAPAASRAAETPRLVRHVQGLEWLTDRVPGGRESIDRPLTLAAPAKHATTLPEEHRRPRAVTPGPDEARRAGAQPSPPVVPPSGLGPAPAPGPEPQRALALPHERGDAADGAFEGEHGLVALVRAWNEPSRPGPAVEAAAPASPSVPVQPELVARDVPEPVVRRRRVAEQPLLPARAPEELLGLGDELGRVLVAELRRYGIEIDR
jgi:hypothetical protein